MDVGANHNGDLETAKELIISAAEMGADAIKFQTYTAEGLYSKKTPKFLKDPVLPYDLIKKYQHPREWLPILNQVAKEHNINSDYVIWHEVGDSREGWTKALEHWEVLAFEKIHKDKP